MSPVTFAITNLPHAIMELENGSTLILTVRNAGESVKAFTEHKPTSFNLVKDKWFVHYKPSETIEGPFESIREAADHLITSTTTAQEEPKDGN